MENFEIKNQKEFMNSLLVGDKFDNFLLKEAVIKTANTFTVDGMVNREYYGNDEDIIAMESPYDYAEWSKVRSTIHALIKGKHTPVSMRVTLYLKPDCMPDVLGSEPNLVDYLILNLHFINGGMNLTTAIAYREFTFDKEPEKLWDRFIAKLLEA